MHHTNITIHFVLHKALSSCLGNNSFCHLCIKYNIFLGFCWEQLTIVFCFCLCFLCTLTCRLLVMQGNILYRFPYLQRTASQKSKRKEYVGRRWADWVGGVEKFFKEKKWQFRFFIYLFIYLTYRYSSLITKS